MENMTWLTMSDGQEIFVREWVKNEGEPIAILQLAHGMAEHIERYELFGQFLLEHGIFLIGNDHRGHGQTGERMNAIGFFAEENGFERVTEDLKEVNEYIHQKYPNIPVYLMGHSMGSFLVRRFVQRFQSGVDGVILSGTGGNPGISGKLAKILAKSQMRKRGKKAESHLLSKLVFGSNNKKVKNAKTEYDWLTRDEAEVGKYCNDPYCGFVGTSTFFYDLMHGLELIHKDSEVKKGNKDLPFYVFSGEDDPIGHDTKGVMQVVNQLKANGIKDVTYTFYPEGRHEMLNELNKDEVMKDIYRWLSEKIIK
ncbi:alpha/beta fold hydrolase [Metabacillus sp. HB246100]